MAITKDNGQVFADYRFTVVEWVANTKNKCQIWHMVNMVWIVKHEPYEKYFNDLEISKGEAKVLIDYLQSLAEISIKFLNDNKIEHHEELRNLDESVN